jgi:uncharacterized protein (DUF1697 family)
MQTWIALVRGINVGGANLVPMARLRELLAGLGFCTVRTLIQSGNCVFEAAAGDAASLAEAIAAAIAGEFGFRPEVLALSPDALDAVLAACPFPQDPDGPARVHVFLLARPPPDADLAGLAALKAPGEVFALAGRAFYLDAPDGIGRSKLAAAVERRLGVPATARNLRTLRALAGLARQPG